MASSIFSYSLISTFKSPNSGKLPPTLAPNSGRMMMSSTVSNPSRPCLKLPPTLASNSGRMMMSTTTTAVSGLDNPCLMLPPTLEGVGGNMVYNFYDLAQNKVINFNNNKIPGKSTRIVGSSHGWLALFNERSSNLILTNPVTRRHVKLPPSSKHVYKVIISCDAEQDECHAMMLSDYMDLAFCRPGRSPTKWTPIGALCRPPYYRRRCYEDLVYTSRHKMLFCVTKTGNGDDLEGWDVASDPPRLRWENRKYGFISDKYYSPCLGRAGELLDVDKIGLLEEKEVLFCETFTYLVFAEQADQLFHVMRHFVRRMAPDGSAVEGDVRYPYKTVAFDVYKIEWELEGEGGYKIEWELEGEGGGLSRVDGGSLGGLAMFVGLNHSFAVSATEANGLKPNSIYFTDDKELTPSETWDKDRKYGGHDIGIFDYENRTISSCYYPCELQSFKRIMPAPIWFTPSHY